MYIHVPVYPPQSFCPYYFLRLFLPLPKVCRIEVSDGESATETDSETESSSDSAQPMAVGSDRAEDGQSSRRVSGKQIDDVLSQIRRAAEVIESFFLLLQ